MNEEETFKRIKQLEDEISKIDYLIDDYTNYREAWVMTQYKKQSGETHTNFEPVTTERFLNPLLENKIVFMMSATPPYFDGYSRVEVDSIFPIETRQWQYVPLGKMSYHYRDKTIPKVAQWLSQLKGKSIVHAISYLTARKLSDALRALGVYPLLQVNQNSGDEHTVMRYDAVNAFVTAKDPDKIMLSVKLDRGVDFWQPDILNNVIAVMPYPNPTEPLVKAKNRLLGKTWQNEEMARTIAQSMGRIFRNEKFGIYNGKPVPKRGYIIDSNFGSWYSNNKKLFPKWFWESQVTITDSMEAEFARIATSEVA